MANNKAEITYFVYTQIGGMEISNLHRQVNEKPSVALYVADYFLRRRIPFRVVERTEHLSVDSKFEERNIDLKELYEIATRQLLLFNIYDYTRKFIEN
jgi:hypothetical protein